MKLTIGYSPCPNDTFIFDEMVNGPIPSADLRFEPVLEDVETLNQWAAEGKLDITKLSFPALFENAGTYELLDSGAALGEGVGPLLVSSKDKEWTETEINQASVAIPGLHTTANLLLSFAYPGLHNKIQFVFSEIENAVLAGKTDLGVIIHENRFTYQDKGLYKVADLGETWEEKMKVPVPLGCIAIKRSLGPEIKAQVEKLIRKSVEVAFAALPRISGYVRRHAQSMNEEVMRKHIRLYVNDHTLSLGDPGRTAIAVLKEVHFSRQDRGEMTR